MSINIGDIVVPHNKTASGSISWTGFLTEGKYSKIAAFLKGNGHLIVTGEHGDGTYYLGRGIDKGDPAVRFRPEDFVVIKQSQKIEVE